MNRKAAIATAGAVSLTVVAGAFAIGANVGLLGARSADASVGQANPVADVEMPAKPKVVTVYEDVPAATPKPKVVEQVVVQTQAPASSSSSSSSSVEGSTSSHDDDAYEHEDESHHDEVDEPDEPEHDGAEDDD